MGPRLQGCRVWKRHNQLQTDLQTEGDSAGPGKRGLLAERERKGGAVRGHGEEARGAVGGRGWSSEMLADRLPSAQEVVHCHITHPPKPGL